MQKLLTSLFIIFFGLICGYIIQRLTLSKKIKIPLNKVKKIFQIIALLILTPIASIGAIWDIDLSSLDIILLPVIGSLAILIGGFTSLIFVKLYKYEKRQAGAFFCCGAITNIGAVGALIVFIILGEHAFAFVPMYKLFEPLIYYGIWFPIAKSFSITHIDNDKNNLIKIVKDPFIIISVISIILGFVLNFSKIERPAIYADINSIIIPISSILLLASIGMAMKFSKIKKYIKPALYISILKFLFVPFVITLLAYALNLGSYENGLLIKVILILSSMPAGFVALVPPSLYDLDVDLANAGWLVTTTLLIVIIPIQIFIISYI